MKRSLKWHNDGATNIGLRIQEMRGEMIRLQTSIDRMQRDYDFRIQQIEEAKKRGLTEFDGDKLLVKRGVK
jgi:hypothetical protein